MAKVLPQESLEVLRVETNYANLSAARMQSLTSWHDSIVAENVTDELPHFGVGKLLALTGNDEVNVLASQHFIELFGQAEPIIFLSGKRREGRPEQHGQGHVRTATLFIEAEYVSHAPARGATFLCLFTCFVNTFQSTRPRGARPCRVVSASRTLSFNPRARAGRDIRRLVIGINDHQFQSTRPRGARHTG